MNPYLGLTIDPVDLGALNALTASGWRVVTVVQLGATLWALLTSLPVDGGGGNGGGPSGPVGAGDVTLSPPVFGATDVQAALGMAQSQVNNVANLAAPINFWVNMPWANSANNAGTLSGANNYRTTSIYLDRPVQVSSILVRTVAALGNQYTRSYDIGLYNWQGQLLMHSGPRVENTIWNTPSTLAVAMLGGPYILQPGWYVHAICTSSLDGNVSFGGYQAVFIYWPGYNSLNGVIDLDVPNTLNATVPPFP